ncbi:MAG: hypothetical protein G01um101419_702 [Parcubacteria group bacterium Gr01-1014_19]|nr:MAG: hypothetical protein G01um101419_702 [Parcubacteria group bacterium Gr01-1014_19]
MTREELIEELIRLWDSPESNDGELVRCWQKIFSSMGIRVRMRVYKRGERKLVDFDEAYPAGVLEMVCDCFEEAGFYLNNKRLRHLLGDLLLDLFRRYSIN